MGVQQRVEGFSLLELLLVLVITVSIVALASPQISNSLDSIKIKRLSREMTTSLRATRAHAISKGKEAVWLLDFKQYHYQYINKTKRYSEKIELSLTTASKEKLSDTAATIRFFPDGSATGGEIRMSHGKLNYSIQIDWLTGRIKVYD